LILGEEFKDHVFRVQVLDQSGAAGRDWRDQLEEILSE